MHRKLTREGDKHRKPLPFTTAEINAVLERLRSECSDQTLLNSIHFGPTALTFVRRLLMAGGTIVTDTYLLANDVDTSLLGQNGARVMCFIDEPYVVSLAEARRATRAEVAVDHALALPGPKLMVVGSAPTALHRLAPPVCADDGCLRSYRAERLCQRHPAQRAPVGKRPGEHCCARQKRWRRRYRYVAQRHPGRGAMKHSRAKLL